MKTAYRTFHQNDQRRAKELQLQAKTGVKWNGYSHRGGTTYTAIVTREVSPSKDAGEKVLDT